MSAKTPAEMSAKFAEDIAGATKESNQLAKMSEMLLANIARAIEGVYEFMRRSPLFGGGRGLSIKDQRDKAKLSDATGEKAVMARKGMKDNLSKDRHILSGVYTKSMKEGTPEEQDVARKNLLAKSNELDTLNIQRKGSRAAKAALKLASAPGNAGAVREAGGLKAYVAEELLKKGFLSEKGKKGMEQVDVLLGDNLTAIEKLGKEANTPQAKANAQEAIKAENAYYKAELGKMGVDANDENYRRYVGELKRGEISPELASKEKKASAERSQAYGNMKRGLGVYFPDEGEPWRLDPQDNVLAFKENERGAAIAAIGGSNPGGGGGQSNTFNISINGGDPQAVYSVIKKVIREAGIHAPKLGGIA